MRRLIAFTVALTLAAAVFAPPAEAHHPVAVGVAATVGFLLAAPFLFLGAVLAPLVPPPLPVVPYAAPVAVARPVVVPRPAYAVPAGPVVAPPPAYAVPAGPVVAPRPVPAAPPGSVTATPARAASTLPASIRTTVVYPHG